jgi:hypothetical protein
MAVVMQNAMLRRVLALPLLVLCAASPPSTGWSADTTRSEKAERLTQQQQQSALEFVREHHPQLNTLITRLEKRDPAEYDKALREVSRTSERLRRMEGRDRPRYEVEIKLWKVNSRIRLAAARMAADQAALPSPALESQLRELLNQRTDLKLQQLTLERERLSSRIERIDSQIAQMSSERDAAIDREVERLQRSARSARVSKQSADGNATDAGNSNRQQQIRRDEQKAGPSRQERPERPLKKPST